MHIEDQRQDIIKLLNEIVEGSSRIRTDNLDVVQLRQILDIGNNGEKILAILNAESEPAEESLPQKDSPEVPQKPLTEEDQDHLYNKLDGIQALNAKKGLSNAGNDKDKYFKNLHRFCEQFEKWRETVLADMEKGLWKEYSIRFETFVKIFDLLGNKELSQQSGKLLSACRKGEFNLCLMETVSACDAMAAFRDELLATPLSQYDSGLKQIKSENKKFVSETKEEKAERIKTRVLELTEKLNELKEACAAFKANKANEIIWFVKHISIDESIDASVEIIAQLVDSLDYDKAAVRIGMLLSILETYHNH